ncbi:MAG TPA: PIN domain-containing protein [Candidatus Sulfotelmatobacter sp.]|jgi:predicted nucleic acid-binding protein|nr:PIN domain-containing protein [Candidatus Sulfotelmatobacter sp.]
MMRAVLADSVALYATADESDSLHERAMRDFGKLESDDRMVIVAYPTLLETQSLVLRRMGIDAAARWIDYMSDAALVNPTPEDYRQAMGTMRAFSGQDISLFDATVAAVALRLGLKVWTYDHHFDVMRVPVWR